MKTNINPVCWFEIYVNDMTRAKKFYSTVLGCELRDAPMADGLGEMSFFPGAGELPNASGALVKMEGVKMEGAATVSTIVYFQCTDCAVEEARVEAAGGIVHKSKFSLGEFGYCAICLDTEGNTFGLYSM
jgi:predicted enzyme related to lactoylglutathione lyase